MNSDKKPRRKSFTKRLENIFRGNAPDIISPPDFNQRDNEEELTDFSDSYILQSLHTLFRESLITEISTQRHLTAVDPEGNAGVISPSKIVFGLICEAIRTKCPFLNLDNQQKVHLCKNWKLVAGGKIDKTPTFPDTGHPANLFFSRLQNILAGKNGWSTERPSIGLQCAGPNEKIVGIIESSTAKEMHILAEGMRFARCQVIPVQGNPEQWLLNKTLGEAVLYQKQIALLGHQANLADSIFWQYVFEEMPELMENLPKGLAVREGWVIISGSVSVRQTITIEIPPGWDMKKFLTALQRALSDDGGESWKYQD